MIEQGENPKTVQHNLGHSDVALTLNIYARTVQKSNVKALNLMADLLEKAEP